MFPPSHRLPQSSLLPGWTNDQLGELSPVGARGLGWERPHWGETTTMYVYQGTIVCTFLGNYNAEVLKDTSVYTTSICTAVYVSNDIPSQRSKRPQWLHLPPWQASVGGARSTVLRLSISVPSPCMPCWALIIWTKKQSYTRNKLGMINTYCRGFISTMVVDVPSKSQVMWSRTGRLGAIQHLKTNHPVEKR